MKKSQSSFYKRFEIVFVKVIPYLFSIHYCWALCQPLFSELIARDILRVLSPNWPFSQFVILALNQSFQEIMLVTCSCSTSLLHLNKIFKTKTILKGESKYFPTWSTATEIDNRGIPLAVSSLSGKSMSVQQTTIRPNKTDQLLYALERNLFSPL